MTKSTFAVHIQEGKKMPKVADSYAEALAAMLEGAGIEVTNDGAVITRTISNCKDNANESTCETDD